MLQFPLSIFHSLIDHLNSFRTPSSQSFPEDLKGWHINEDEVALKSRRVDFLSALKIDLKDGNLRLLEKVIPFLD
jgi:hypothetical protein